MIPRMIGCMNVTDVLPLKKAQINAAKYIATAYFQRQTEYVFIW